MARKLKAYHYTRSSGPPPGAVDDALGPDRRGFRQLQMLVAAHSLDEARVLFGAHPGDMRHLGGITENPASVERAMAKPGQVFARRTGMPDAPWVEVDASTGPLVLGGSTLERAAELVQRERDRKDQTKAYIEQQRAARHAAQERRAETERRAAEAVGPLREALAEHGVHPDTITAGTAVELPPEVAELVTTLLAELAHLRAL